MNYISVLDIISQRYNMYPDSFRNHKPFDILFDELFYKPNYIRFDMDNFCYTYTVDSREDRVKIEFYDFIEHMQNKITEQGHSLRNAIDTNLEDRKTIFKNDKLVLPKLLEFAYLKEKWKDKNLSKEVWEYLEHMGYQYVLTLIEIMLLSKIVKDFKIRNSDLITHYSSYSFVGHLANGQYEQSAQELREVFEDEAYIAEKKQECIEELVKFECNSFEEIEKVLFEKKEEVSKLPERCLGNYPKAYPMFARSLEELLYKQQKEIGYEKDTTYAITHFNYIRACYNNYFLYAIYSVLLGEDENVLEETPNSLQTYNTLTYPKEILNQIDEYLAYRHLDDDIRNVEMFTYGNTICSNVTECYYVNVRHQADNNDHSIKGVILSKDIALLKKIENAFHDDLTRKFVKLHGINIQTYDDTNYHSLIERWFEKVSESEQEHVRLILNPSIISFKEEEKEKEGEQNDE